MSEQNQFLLYTAPDGEVKVDVFFKDETVWLTQKTLAELFGVQVPGINKHLKNIFDSGELMEESVISILETTAADGKNYQTRYYNLDAIIAVGYTRFSASVRTRITSRISTGRSNASKAGNHEHRARPQSRRRSTKRKCRTPSTSLHNWRNACRSQNAG